MIPGYKVRHLEECDGEPPLTGATKAFGALWYGNQKPTLILSSRNLKDDMIMRIKPDNIRLTARDGKLSFMFNGAIWTHQDGIEEDVIVLLNEKFPEDDRFNGFYRPCSLGFFPKSSIGASV
jgi:hypothetical protein